MNLQAIFIFKSTTNELIFGIHKLTYAIASASIKNEPELSSNIKQHEYC